MLSREEVVSVFQHLHGTPSLMASLMYGAGLRLLECARLRVKDLDFGRHEITVRDGKGRKDRVTVLPAKLATPLRIHIERVRRRYDHDRPAAVAHRRRCRMRERKYPDATAEWPWQWVFAASRMYVHGPTGKRRRHHLHESVRHSFATHLLDCGYDIRTRTQTVVAVAYGAPWTCEGVDSRRSDNPLAPRATQMNRPDIEGIAAHRLPQVPLARAAHRTDTCYRYQVRPATGLP